MYFCLDEIGGSDSKSHRPLQLLKLKKRINLNYYIDIILPVPLQKLFTYQINEEEAKFLKRGMRVAVPFGKSKLFTGIVFQVHQNTPKVYEAKEIHQILDEKPIVTTDQLELWQWMADYYMCTLGEVMRAALPSSFLLQSETKITLNKDFTEEHSLTEKEFTVFEALQHHQMLDVEKISSILSRKTVLPIIKSLLDKSVVQVEEVLYEKYTPKFIKYVRLQEPWHEEVNWGKLIDTLKGAKQKEALLYYFQEKAVTGKPINFTAFLKKYQISHAVMKALAEKQIFEIYALQEDRLKPGGGSKKLPELNDLQQKKVEEVYQQFQNQSITLLHGVTGGGKTEIYMHLIQR